MPDLPGRFSAGDTIDEAMVNAEEAIDLWIEAALDAGADIPAPSTLGEIHARPEFAGWAFALVSIDPAALEDTIERVNITTPRRILPRLDQRARAAGGIALGVHREARVGLSASSIPRRGCTAANGSAQ